jgi:hypothetical protein
MRNLILNGTILTAVESMQLQIWISQQVGVADNLRTKGTGIDTHLQASELFKISELKNDR